jgi:hypothetical protein
MVNEVGTGDIGQTRPNADTFDGMATPQTVCARVVSQATRRNPKEKAGPKKDLLDCRILML